MNTDIKPASKQYHSFEEATRDLERSSGETYTWFSKASANFLATVDYQFGQCIHHDAVEINGSKYIPVDTRAVDDKNVERTNYLSVALLEAAAKRLLPEKDLSFPAGVANFVVFIGPFIASAVASFGLGVYGYFKNQLFDASLRWGLQVPKDKAV